MIPVQNPSSLQEKRPAPELVSIVVPVHNESANIDPLIDAIRQAMGNANFELILVDDGSSDDTFARIDAAAAQDPRICGVSLSRNFGHQYALAAGLHLAGGDATIMMDGDLQHPPELIPQMIEKWREGFNIVQAVRIDEPGIGACKKFTSHAFYKIFGLLCGMKLQAGSADFRLVDKIVLAEINRMEEGQLFLRGLVSWMGYRQTTISYQANPRHAGASKYTLGKMLKLARGGIFSFSTMPLRIGITIGFIMSVLSFLELAFVLVAYAMGWTVQGWASMVAIITLLFGVLFLLVGVQGEYIARIYERVQHRPPFLIERIVRRKHSST